MDASRRLSTMLAISDLLSHHGLACDLLLSAFASAAKCGRRATVCKPFPVHIMEADAFDAASAAVDSIEVDQLDTATDTQLQLLQWLLLHLQRTWLVSEATSAQLLSELGPVCGLSALHNAMQQSCCVFRVEPASSPPHNPQPQQPKQLMAFHGTDFANLHSILHQGLLAGSGTRLQTTGAFFGQGIYLSTDFSTAFSYTCGRQAWTHSALGQHLRCVLVCEVAEHVAIRQDTHASPAGSNRLPETYIVAHRPSDVQIKYLLVLSDDGLLGRVPRRISTSSTMAGSRPSDPGVRVSATSACWALTCAYLAMMLLFAFWRQLHAS